MSTFNVGQLVTLSYTVVDAVTKLPVTPSTCTLSVVDPTGLQTNYIPMLDDVGLYHYDLLPSWPGAYRYRWVSTGAGQASEDGEFDIRAPYTAVVGLSDVKDALNIPASDVSHDAELAGFVNAATAQVSYLVGPIAPQTYTETRDGGSAVIMLDNPPVISITSVVEYVTPGGQALTLQPLGSGTDNYGYTLDDPASGKLVRRGAGGFEQPFWGGRGAVVITYLAGSHGVAPDVRLAVLEDIRGLYQQTQQGGRSTMGGGMIGAAGDDQWSGGGPMRLFPRLAALLGGPNRTQSIG